MPDWWRRLASSARGTIPKFLLCFALAVVIEGVLKQEVKFPLA